MAALGFRTGDAGRSRSAPPSKSRRWSTVGRRLRAPS